MTTIGILVNKEKPKAIVVAQELVMLLEQRKADICLEPDIALEIGRADLGLEKEDFPKRADLLFVLGGDGTLLGVARRFAPYRLPILGINLGHLGFLSEAEPEDLSIAVDRVLAKDYYIEDRMMLDAEVIRDGQVLKKSIAFNDVGIAKGSFGRMITVQVSLGGTDQGHIPGMA